MARSNTANGGSSYFDIGIQIVSAGVSSYTLRGVIWLTSLNVNDSTNDLTVGGNFSRSGPMSLDGVYSSTVIWTQDIEVPRTGVNQTISINAAFSGVNYWGVTLSGADSIVVPAAGGGGGGIPPSGPTLGYQDVTATSVQINVITFPPDGGSPITSLRYHLYRATDNVLLTTVFDGATHIFSGLFRASPYYVFAQACNDNGCGPQGPRVDFITSPSVTSAPAAPVVDQVAITSARIRWSSPGDHGGSAPTSYHVVVARDAALTDKVVDQNVGNVLTYQFTTGAANTNYWTAVSAINGVGASPFSAATAFTTTANAPAAPTALTVTRVSDTNHTLNWTNNPTAPAPYVNVWVARRVDGGAWASIANLAGTATTYSDTTTSANHAYEYYVSATNPGGSSVASNTVAIVTTPSSPSGQTAVRGSGATAVVSWTNTSAVPYQTIIQETNGSGGWGATKATLAAGVTTWTDVAPRAGVTQYRLAHVSTVNVVGLTSAFVTTSTVAVIAPPNAPTPISPNGIVLDVLPSVVFTWVHNPVDGSAQTKYQIRHREVGQPSWVERVAVASAASTATIAGVFNNGKQYEWQVRTWGTASTGGGEGTGSSNWSATAAFTSSAKPIATINTPANGSSYGTSTMTVTWGYFDAEGTPQAQWEAQLILWPEDQVIETRTGVGATATVTFTTKVNNARQYRVRVRVQDGSGLWSDWSVSTVNVAYLPPQVVLLQAVWHPESGVIALQLLPQPVIVGSEVPAVSVDIERSIDGGPWVLVANDVAPNAAVIDTQPTTSGTNTYRLIVTSAIPSSRTHDPAAIVVVNEVDNGYIGSGPGFGSTQIIGCNLITASATSLSKALYHFAGRPKPLEFAGTAERHAVTVKGTVTGDPTTVFEMEALARQPGVILWRDPSGRRIYGSLGEVTAAQVDMGAPDVWEVGFTVTEVDYP